MHVAGVDEQAVLEAGVDGERDRGVRVEVDLRAQEGVNVRTGEVAPASEPRKTRSSAPSTRTGSGTWCWKSRPAARSASGRATHSWTPWSTVVSAVETSEWAMPWPPVMRLSSPGRMNECVPRLSRCSIVPLNSQLTVCSPVCGCGGRSMPPGPTSTGP
nr:hypothetical protein GCM10025730_10000 [Promicromonospora thailandica]